MTRKTSLNGIPNDLGKLVTIEESMIPAGAEVLKPNYPLKVLIFVPPRRPHAVIKNGDSFIGIAMYTHKNGEPSLEVDYSVGYLFSMTSRRNLSVSLPYRIN